MTVVKVRRPPLVQYPVPECWHGNRTTPHVKGVAHTTEGGGTVETLGNYFRHTPGKLCSTFCVEPTGRAGIYVPINDLTIRTYHVKDHNSECYGIEQIGHAATSRAVWLKRYRRQLYMTAWIFAWADSVYPGGEITTQAAGSAATGRKFTHSEGLTQHMWVPANDHDDCGPGYPWDVVLGLAMKWTRTGGPTFSTRFYIKFGHRPT